MDAGSSYLRKESTTPALLCKLLTETSKDAEDFKLSIEGDILDFDNRDLMYEYHVCQGRKEKGRRKDIL